MPQSQQTSDLSTQYLAFIRQQAKALRGEDATPKRLKDWQTSRETIRRQLIKSLGGFPKQHCDLEPRVLGTIDGDGYRLEKIVFQTRPGILMTANAYVPDGASKAPAVLCVHGHWKGAKQDPVVQARCIGLAKLGYFVLAVDAFGAGERGLQKPLGEYHGEMVASTLWASGLSLAGLQVYENMRAVDYLQSRPEVDPDRIGITGTSGGGNQTMYAGALEERFKCVVPVCSVGNYQAYLGVACCMCEVTPGALTYTEEWGVLGLVAPRALMVINATQDGIQFSVAEAKKSLAKAREIFKLYDRSERVRHQIVESRHDYNQPMREAMYGWMGWHLKGEGDGSPMVEPTIETRERELIRCFPKDSRPATFVTLPQFAANASKERLSAKNKAPSHAEEWDAQRMTMETLLPRVLGGISKTPASNVKVGNNPDGLQDIQFDPEPGITVLAHRQRARGDRKGLCVLLDLDKGRIDGTSSIVQAAVKSDWDIVSVDLRATGATAHRSDKIGRAPDHNTAQWGMWVGRPLLGQWVVDVKRLLDVLDQQAGGLPKNIHLIGQGAASVVALCAAALDDRVTKTVTINGLSSFVSDRPYEGQRVGILAPGMLRDVGDIPQIASLIAPRAVTMVASVDSAGQPISGEQWRSEFAFTRSVFLREKRSVAIQYSEKLEVTKLFQ